MNKRLATILLTLCMVLSLLPVPALGTGTTKTINCDTFILEISDVYAIESVDKSASDGYFTTYCIVVPASATVKCTEIATTYPNSYLLRPYNDIVFKGGPMYPDVEFACEYDDAIYVGFSEGTSISTVVNNEYSFSGGTGGRYYNIRIFVVDDETLVQFGGPTPAPKPSAPTGNVSASPSNTNFVVKGLGRDDIEKPKFVTQAYMINGTNYLQLRAIAVLLNRTVAQFNVGWDGQYAVIEPGKPFSGTVTGSKMQDTKYIRTSDTKFKMNGEVFSFSDARLINGDTNYIQLREFAQKLSGTASKFNVYWDDAAGKAVIQPGVPYTGTKYEEPKTILKEFKAEGDVLPDGDYYMQIAGKYVYPVSGGQYWLELHDEMPEKPFNIKLVSNSKDRGPKYSIAYNGTYIMLPGSAEGAQLQSTTSKTPHYWRISINSSFCTISDYSNQKLLVNAIGKTRKGDTKIIGSSSAGSVPDSAKIIFFTKPV